MAQQDMFFHWITASQSEGSGDAPEARFPYWSFTKTVWAVCALQLVEDGALSLDGPLPGRAYSLRQLLGHRAGLPDYGQFPAYGAAVTAGEPPWSRQKMLDTALSNGMLFAPGQGWTYSNVGYMFLRELIEDTTGAPIDQMVHERITGPLGLTSVRLDRTQAAFSELHWPAAATYDPGWVYHGCLTGTAGDAARLLHHLFAGDLLSPEMMVEQQKTTPLGGPLPGRPWDTCGYALGFMAGTVESLGRSIGHSGCGPFSVNAVYHFPDLPDPVTVACFTDGCVEGVAEQAAVHIAETQFV